MRPRSNAAQAVRDLHPRTQREVVPISDRLEHRGESARPAWVDAAPDAAPRPFYDPPRAEASPPPPPVDPTSTPEFHRMMQQAKHFAEEQGVRAAEAEIQGLRDRYLAAIGELERISREASRPHGHEIVSLAMVVAREIIGREVAADRNVLASAIDDAIDQAGAEAPLRIRVARPDLEYLGRTRRDLIESGVVFVEDGDLAPGGCVIETSQRVVDATIATRLEAARDAVLEVLEHPEAAQRLSLVGGAA